MLHIFLVKHERLQLHRTHLGSRLIFHVEMQPGSVCEERPCYLGVITPPATGRFLLLVSKLYDTVFALSRQASGGSVCIWLILSLWETCSFILVSLTPRRVLDLRVIRILTPFIPLPLVKGKGETNLLEGQI